MPINDRLRELRLNGFKMNMERFGEILGISKSGVSEIESGRRNVTEQHIRLILNTSIDGKHVNEEWLRTGVGEMFISIDIEDEIAAMISKIPNEPLGSFKRRLLGTLASLSEDQWELLADIAERLAEKEGSE